MQLSATGLRPAGQGRGPGGIRRDGPRKRASRLIHRLAREEYKVIFLTEPLFAACGEAVAQYKSETFPAIIPIPDSHGTSGVAMANIKANVEKAIGADILFAEEK